MSSRKELWEAYTVGVRTDEGGHVIGFRPRDVVEKYRDAIEAKIGK